MLSLTKAGLSKTCLFLHRLNCLTALPALVILVFTDVAMRSFGLQSPTWSHEVSGLLLLTIFFCSLPHCYIKNEFLAVDFLYRRLSIRLQQFTQLLSYGFVLSFSTIFSWQSYANAIEMIEYEEEAYTVALPLWPFSIIVCVSTGLIALYAVTQILDRSWQLKQA